jgi:hypothetical protein
MKRCKTFTFRARRAAKGGATPAKPGFGEQSSPPGAFWGGIVKNQVGLDSEVLYSVAEGVKETER